MNTAHKTTELAGRILIVAMFLIAGLAKISGYAGTQAYMASAGVPGALLPLVIALEVLGAIAIIVGFQTRPVAAALAAFTVVAAFLFHNVPGDQLQQTMLLKNLAVAGGLLVLAARGAGDWSVDALRADTRIAGRT